MSDLHGLFSYTISVMMDQETFDLYSQYVVSGIRSRSERFAYLTEMESHLAQVIIEHGLRLEQEHIPQAYAITRLKQLLASSNR